MSDTYYMPTFDRDGALVSTRPATPAEVRQINPTAAAIVDLQAAVDQLVLDALMGA